MLQKFQQQFQCMIYGSHTWPTKVEDELKKNRSEMCMRDDTGLHRKRTKNAELKELLPMGPIKVATKEGKSRCV